MNRGDFVQLAALITLSVCGLAVQAFGEPKPAPAARIARIREYVHDQKQDLADAKSRLSWTWRELENANLQIVQVAKERDGWKSYGNEMERRWMADEVDLAKYRKHGFFSGLLSVVGLVGSFIVNPFGFIVGKVAQTIFALVISFALIGTALFIFRQIRKRKTS